MRIWLVEQTKKINLYWHSQTNCLGNNKLSISRFCQHETIVSRWTEQGGQGNECLQRPSSWTSRSEHLGRAQCWRKRAVMKITRTIFQNIVQSFCCFDFKNKKTCVNPRLIPTEQPHRLILLPVIAVGQRPRQPWGSFPVALLSLVVAILFSGEFPLFGSRCLLHSNHFIWRFDGGRGRFCPFSAVTHVWTCERSWWKWRPLPEKDVANERNPCDLFRAGAQ